jgi:hypothetical protein
MDGRPCACDGRAAATIHPSNRRACVRARVRAPERRDDDGIARLWAMRCDGDTMRCAQEEEALWEEFVADRLRRGLDHAKEASNRLSPQRRSDGKARTNPFLLSIGRRIPCAATACGGRRHGVRRARRSGEAVHARWVQWRAPRTRSHTGATRISPHARSGARAHAHGRNTGGRAVSAALGADALASRTARRSAQCSTAQWQCL